MIAFDIAVNHRPQIGGIFCLYNEPHVDPNFELQTTTHEHLKIIACLNEQDEVFPYQYTIN